MSWENFPYFDEAEIHEPTQTFRVRFHYLKGAFPVFDAETNKITEHRIAHRGVIVYRPARSLLEVRTKYKGMASKVVNRAAVHLHLDPFFAVNLLNEEYIKRFIDWINSLNNARIELPFSNAMGSLMITARKGMDLRKVKRFHDELRHGRLRGGHVTIVRDEVHRINFNIYFRDGHLSFTSFCSEQDVESVASALEKILEGYEFVTSKRLLEEFFGEES